jgi:hypothetical protein
MRKESLQFIDSNPLKKSTKSQTTIFIIFSIIVFLIIIFTVVYTNYNKDSTAISLNKQSEVLVEEIKNCFYNIYKESIDEVSLHGGYFNEPLTPYLKNDLESIPFYYFGELSYIPEIELLEEEITSSVDSKKDICLDIINSSGLNYEYYYNLPKTSIKENEIKIEEKIKLILSKGSLTHTIEFKDLKKIKSHLLDINSFASYISYSYMINNESLCLSCFQEIAINKNLILEIDDSLENILIITITETKEDYYPRFYLFALSATGNSETMKIPEEYKLPNNEEKELNIDAFKNE